MVDDLTKAFGRRIDALAWMTPETKAKRQGQGGDAVRRRRLSRQVDRLLVAADREGRCDRQRAARRAVRVSPAARQAGAAGRPDRVVDDAADGERGQPAAAERAQLSRRDPAAAVLRSRRATPPRTTARSARPSATRSATASTTSGSQFDAQGRLANWWTPQDLEHFKQPAKRWRRSTTPIGRSRIWRSTGTRCSARTSRIWPGWPPPTTRITCR